MIYDHWINEFVNKGLAGEYMILQYPDLVQIVYIEPSGQRQNYKITDRRFAQKMADDSPQTLELVDIDVKRQIASDIELSNNIATKNNLDDKSLKVKSYFKNQVFFFLSFLLLVPFFSKSVRTAIKRYIDVNINVITVIVGIISIILAVMTIIITTD